MRILLRQEILVSPDALGRAMLRHELDHQSDQVLIELRHLVQGLRRIDAEGVRASGLGRAVWYFTDDVRRIRNDPANAYLIVTKKDGPAGLALVLSYIPPDSLERLIAGNPAMTGEEGLQWTVSQYSGIMINGGVRLFENRAEAVAAQSGEGDDRVSRIEALDPPAPSEEPLEAPRHSPLPFAQGQPPALAPSPLETWTWPEIKFDPPDDEG